MMYCIQRLSLCDEGERQLFLRDDEVATIGTGPSVSLRLHNSFGFPTLCLKIWIEKDACIARNMTGAADLVFLNGQPLFDLVQLEDGDALQIGSDQFLFLIFNDDEHSSTDQPFPCQLSTSANPAVGSQSDHAFLSTSVNRTVVRHEPRDIKWSFGDFVSRLSRSYPLMQFVDLHQAGLARTESSLRSADPFSVPNLILQEQFSLHVITDTPVSTHLQLQHQIAGRGASVWAVPLNTANACLTEAQPYFPWLVRPGILEMFLRQSSRDFCLALLKPFRAIILPESNYARSWCVLSDSSLRPDVLLSRS